jgi:hypothetical protein
MIEGLRIDCRLFIADSARSADSAPRQSQSAIVSPIGNRAGDFDNPQSSLQSAIFSPQSAIDQPTATDWRLKIVDCSADCSPTIGD